MLQQFFVALPRSVPRYNPVSEVYRQFLGLHVLVCALTCTVNYGTFLYHDQSTQFTAGGLHRVVETSEG